RPLDRQREGPRSVRPGPRRGGRSRAPPASAGTGAVPLGSMRFLARALAVAALAVAALLSAATRAQGPPEELFGKGTAALGRGEYGVAIDTFEALADQGFVHPDASYDRGLAYVMRYRAHADRPGDLGRAAAAFEEALLLRPSDREAQAALDLVRAEVTRKRARGKRDAVEMGPTIDRVVVGLADEQ